MTGESRTFDLRLGDHAVRVRSIPADPAADARPALVFLHDSLGSISVWRDFPDRLAAALGCPSLDANLTATFLTLRGVLPGMKARRRGSVVTVWSAAARRPSGFSPVPYAAANAGVQLLTRTAAAQAGPFGIRVNCVAPETILTERNAERIPAARRAALADEHPVRRRYRRVRASSVRRSTRRRASSRRPAPSRARRSRTGRAACARPRRGRPSASGRCPSRRRPARPR